MIISCDLPEIYFPILKQEDRYIVYHGGRGGGKTYKICKALVIRMMNETERGVNYCCMRETQKTLQDSSKSVIMWAINQLGLNQYFHTSRTSDEIRCLYNDCTFKFRGIGTIADAFRFKSIDRVKIAWIDEAQTMKAEVWEVFTPSVRGNPSDDDDVDIDSLDDDNLLPDSQIIISFNPRKKTDFIYEFFINNPPSSAKVYQINYYDNPDFFSNSSLRIDMKECLERMPNRFNHIWLGGTSSAHDQILNPAWWYRYESLQAVIKLCTGMFIAADTACKVKNYNDYSVIQCWGYNQHHGYLLGQIRERLAFPDLVNKIKKFTVDWCSMGNRIRPSRVYIEDKSSGIPLAQTLYSQGFSTIFPWKPKDYNFPEDKVGRACEAAFMLSSGVFYIPADNIADWARGFVNECSDFDAEMEGFDDQVDTFTMAASVLRSMNVGGIST